MSIAENICEFGDLLMLGLNKGKESCYLPGLNTSIRDNTRVLEQLRRCSTIYLKDWKKVVTQRFKET